MGYFLPFDTNNSPKNGNFKTMKKKPEDIIILHKCNKTHDHMLNCSWDKVHDGCNCYFHFGLFLHFYPHNSPSKWKFQKKKKKNLEISSFYTSILQTMIICYTVLKIWHVMDVIVFHFGLFVALLPYFIANTFTP